MLIAYLFGFDLNESKDIYINEQAYGRLEAKADLIKEAMIEGKWPILKGTAQKVGLSSADYTQLAALCY